MDTQEEFDFLQSGPASTSGRSDAEQLKGALQNERASPEILAFETDLIGRIEQNMDYQARPSWSPPPPAEAWRQPPRLRARTGSHCALTPRPCPLPPRHPPPPTAAAGCRRSR